MSESSPPVVVPGTPALTLAYRVGVSILVMLGGLALFYFPPFGVDRELLAHMPAPVGIPAVMALFNAFALVEVAAVLVPRWRHLRLEERGGRARLRRVAILLAIVLLMLQCLGLTFWFQGAVPEMLTLPPSLFRAAMAITWLTGLGAAIFLADWGGRYGIGSGFAVLLLFFSGHSLLDGDHSFWTSWRLWTPTVHACLALAGATLLLQHRRLEQWVVAPARSPRAWLLLPGAGLLPALLAAEFIAFVLSTFQVAQMSPALATSSQLVTWAWLQTGVWTFAVLVGTTIVCTLLLRPATLATRWQVDTTAARHAIRRAILVALPLPLLVAVVSKMPVVDSADGPALSFGPAIGLVLAIAVISDFVRELRFCARHEASVVIDVQRLELLGPIRHALERREIPFHFSGTATRGLLQIFGPLVPVSLFVPFDDLDRAEEVVLPLVLEATEPANR